MSKDIKPAKDTNETPLATSKPINIPGSLPKSFDLPHATIEYIAPYTPDLIPDGELIGVFWLDSLNLC